MKTRSKFKILKFINSNANWRAVLSAPPYNLIIRDDGEYTIVKYNQIFSDFKEQMVRESRGFIIKKVENKYKFVCVPFTKFFCFGDPNALKDLNKLYRKKQWHIEEKIDGSLIKLWYDNNEWHISTNGTIDSSKADIQFEMNGISNYKQLFEYASRDKIEYDKLDKQYTYLFELVGLENKVIVPYETEDVYYLGRRNNYTLHEIPYAKDDCTGVKMCKRPKYRVVDVDKNPKQLMKQLQDDVNKLTKSDKHFEGYVISDSSLKTRIKMKSSQYMELFFKKGNGIFTPRKILLMILDHKDDDIISSFPEYKSQFDIVRKALYMWIEKIKNDFIYMKDNTWEDRKSFAEWAKTSTCPMIMFSVYNQGCLDDEFIENKIKTIQIDNLVNYIGLNESEENNNE